MPSPPPSSVYWLVEQSAPGLMRWFVGSVLESHRYARGATLTSWWRSSQHNRSVGGAPSSQHLAALAVDVDYLDPAERAQVAQRARALGLVVVDDYADGHAHLQALSAGALARLGLEQLAYTV